MLNAHSYVLRPASGVLFSVRPFPYLLCPALHAINCTILKYHSCENPFLITNSFQEFSAVYVHRLSAIFMLHEVEALSYRRKIPLVSAK